MERPPVPDHVRERLARIIADQLRREHPDAVVEIIDVDPDDPPQGSGTQSAHESEDSTA